MCSTPPPSGPPAGELTLLLQRLESGEPQGADRILPLVYDELRKLAAAKMSRENPGQTLQATALVHEAWLRLGGDQQPNWRNRAHFFAAAAEAMRRILVDNARRRRAQRHGGALEKVRLDQTGFDVAAPQLDDEGVIQLDEALARLSAHDARKAEIVKQCCFVGLTLDEAAAAMGISARTAKRDWAYARAWLFSEMKTMQGGGGQPGNSDKGQGTSGR